MRPGKLEVFIPGTHTYLIKKSGQIVLDNYRVSIIEEKTKEEHSYPSNWCHIIWDSKKEIPAIHRKECISIQCYREADPDTGYCQSHSLYR